MKRTARRKPPVESSIVLGRKKLKATLRVKHWDPWAGSCTPEAVPGQPPLMADAVSFQFRTAQLTKLKSRKRLFDGLLAAPGQYVDFYHDMADPGHVNVEIHNRPIGVDNNVSFKADGILSLSDLDALIELLREGRRQVDKVVWDPQPVTPGLK